MSPRSGPASRPSKDTGRAPVGSFGSAAGAPVTSVRADVWLWAVRVYRTRALAQAACKGGHVKIDGGTAKASTPIRVTIARVVSRAVVLIRLTRFGRQRLLGET